MRLLMACFLGVGDLVHRLPKDWVSERAFLSGPAALNCDGTLPQQANSISWSTWHERRNSALAVCLWGEQSLAWLFGGGTAPGSISDQEPGTGANDNWAINGQWTPTGFPNNGVTNTFHAIVNAGTPLLNVDITLDQLTFTGGAIAGDEKLDSSQFHRLERRRTYRNRHHESLGGQLRYMAVKKI